ncbi:hypothetical protein [Microbacterium sp. GCS4]|uniref:hypothetical protein n=1 Tax=Microbacterium sp. GCS4 TaxID=1692239 RepID=UPI0013791FC4|nr:hypothetical protein [Microbacterium sp. GCS4]
MATAVAVIAAGLTLGTPTSAEAAVVQWGTNSGTAPNYQANVNGDFLMAGNGVLACSATTATTNGSCVDLHAASSTNAQNVKRQLRHDTEQLRDGVHLELEQRDHDDPVRSDRGQGVPHLERQHRRVHG